MIRIEEINWYGEDKQIFYIIMIKESGKRRRIFFKFIQNGFCCTLENCDFYIKGIIRKGDRLSFCDFCNNITKSPKVKEFFKANCIKVAFTVPTKLF